MILSDDMILNTDKIIFSDLLPHVQPVRSHWQPFAFRHSLGTLAITSIFSLSSYFNFHNWFTALTWKAVHPNLIPVDLLAFTFSTPLSLSMHQFHFQYNFSTPLSHSQDHFHNTTFFSEGHFHFLNTTFTFSIPLSLSMQQISLSQCHFQYIFSNPLSLSQDHFHNTTFFFLKITFTFSTQLSLSQHHFHFQPSPGKLFIPALCRLIFIPLFLLCNYRPSGVERLWPVSFWHHCWQNHHDVDRPGPFPLGRPLLVFCHFVRSLRRIHCFPCTHVLPQVIIIITINISLCAGTLHIYVPKWRRRKIFGENLKYLIHRSVGAEYASIAGMMGAAAIGVQVSPSSPLSSSLSRLSSSSTKITTVILSLSPGWDPVRVARLLPHASDHISSCSRLGIARLLAAIPPGLNFHFLADNFLG